MRFEVLTFGGWTNPFFFKATWSGFIIEGMLWEPKMIALVNSISIYNRRRGKI